MLFWSICKFYYFDIINVSGQILSTSKEELTNILSIMDIQVGMLAIGYVCLQVHELIFE